MVLNNSWQGVYAQEHKHIIAFLRMRFFAFPATALKQLERRRIWGC